MALLIGQVPAGFLSSAGSNGILIPVPPPNGGSIGWGDVYVSFGSDWGDAGLRVAIYNSGSSSWRVVHVKTLSAGPRVGFQLQQGDEKISVVREALSASDPGTCAVGWMLEATLKAAA